MRKKSKKNSCKSLEICKGKYSIKLNKSDVNAIEMAFNYMLSDSGIYASAEFRSYKRRIEKLRDYFHFLND